MKRDMDLARNILLAIEEDEFDNRFLFSPSEDYSLKQVMYHLGLLYQAGLIKAVHVESMYGDEYAPEGLTWQGHDFVESARNDTTWNKAKATIADKGGAMTFEVIKGLLSGFAKAHMGLS